MERRILVHSGNIEDVRIGIVPLGSSHRLRSDSFYSWIPLPPYSTLRFASTYRTPTS